MKKDLVELVFILDRSGSMRGLEKDTIGGFNAMIEKQKKLEGEALVTTVLFDNEFEILHNRLDMKTLPLLTEADYFVRGSTALLDAVGRSITKINYIHEHLDKDDVPEKTIFVITTDGHENASREYTTNAIKNLIDKQKMVYDWEFIFLGANIDAVRTAERYGIRRERAAQYHSDSIGTQSNFVSMHHFIRDVRSQSIVDDNWKKEIEEDFKNRNKKH